jgi:hypothetical protein
MARDLADGATVSFGSVFTSLKLSNIGHSGISRNTVDASSLSTAGGKDFLASSMYDPGELSCELHFDPSLKTTITAALTNDSTAQALTITYPNGGTATTAWSAYGYLTGFEITAAKEELMTATATVKLSGSIG